jgi:chemotaxis signal transduction protein/ABC-type nitrate/sulfonate/bicarbonate transport system substrate-binding protein
MEHETMAIDPGMTILLVEDSGATRKMEIMIMKKLGFSEILEAEEGAGAVEILQSGRKVDLVVSDWNMPGMSGLELLQWMRGNEEFASVPFIMATGRGERRQAEIAMDAGANGMVSKPFTPDELRRVMEEIYEHGTVQAKDTSAARQPVVTPDGKVRLSIAHIQITDHLVLGVLKHMIESGEVSPRHFELETRCMPSWNPVAGDLETAQIDGACVLAPIAMDLFGAGVPIRLVLLAHKNGSIMVRSKRAAGSRDGFRGKTFLIPHQLSIHHMLSHMYMTEMGLKAGTDGDDLDVKFEVVPPVKMPEFLGSNADVSGYMVAEPLGTKAIAGNIAELQFLSAEAWQNHPCCVVTLRKEVVDAHPEAVQEFCSLLVRAGGFIERRPETAAEIGVGFLDPKGELGLTSTVLKNVLTEPAGITNDDLYPVVADLKQMNEYMVKEMGIGSLIDFDEFVDLRFADKACGGNVRPQSAVSSLRADSLVKRVHAARTADSMDKVMLDKEGKYLIFEVAAERYGIGILKMKEIIGLTPVTTMPNKPQWFRGIINLRDQIVPLLDLRAWFGDGLTEFHDRTPIIVVETAGLAKSEFIGIVVDSVAEIVNISAKDVEAAPSLGTDAQYILAMAKLKNSASVLLDVDKVVADTAYAIN